MRASLFSCCAMPLPHCPEEEEAALGLAGLHAVGTLSLSALGMQKTCLLAHHGGLVVTTHSNLPRPDIAQDAEVVLRYTSRTKSAAPKTILTRRILPSRFFHTNPELDLTLVACEPVVSPELSPLPLVKSAHVLDTGHRLYILGHMQTSDRRGAAVLGRARVCSMDDINKGIIGFLTDGCTWAPGSAGFNEHGDFSFIVTQPMQTTNDADASEVPVQPRRCSFFKKETTVRQYGILIDTILHWLEQNGLQNLDDIVAQRKQTIHTLDTSLPNATLRETSSLLKASEDSKRSQISDMAEVQKPAASSSYSAITEACRDMDSRCEKLTKAGSSEDNDKRMIGVERFGGTAKGLSSVKEGWENDGHSYLQSECVTLVCKETSTVEIGRSQLDKLDSESMYVDIPLENTTKVTGERTNANGEAGDGKLRDEDGNEIKEGICEIMVSESIVSTKEAEKSSSRQLNVTQDASNVQVGVREEPPAISIDKELEITSIQASNKEDANVASIGIRPGHGDVKRRSIERSKTITSLRLKPEEISRRIEGYGNVTSIVRKDLIHTLSFKDPHGGNDSVDYAKFIAAPLNSVIDVGTSLVQKGVSAIGIRAKMTDMNQDPSHSTPVNSRKGKAPQKDTKKSSP